ncbi:sensor histidine kinase [Aromatoleum petrolei]|uniref:Sensor histidine kinase n=1 Tax=Aromatoleum petrolei TaxID=76116 RepID=A0ABX1MLT6_9RHOO|nr:histidine kinase [Aromatoleum petrolei]NMF88928.1 sensor histidine kinase [Aromatoleum petrolei]QTQ37789.1 Putative two component system sensor histidine kinase [Aromatoleum petrolei]
MDNAPSHDVVTLPDFRNLGVLLRILVIAEAANLVTLAAHAPDAIEALKSVGGAALPFEFSLLAVALSLFLLSPLLARMPYRRGVCASVALAATVAGALDLAFHSWVGAVPWGAVLKSIAMAGLLAAMILGYFNWRQRVLSPALAKARLMALQSRIRPHFLFNSLNTAVSLVRQDPCLAEQVLLDMSDLFRALLKDSRSLVPLADEIRLAEAYLQIEQLRLGERLRVHWNREGAQAAVNVPILVLQPLLENAVRYGVEPFAAGGDVHVAIRVGGGELVIEVTNSICGGDMPVPSGNRIALANIEERLGLHFDAEGTLHISTRDNLFVVKVCVPFRGACTAAQVA